MLIYLPKTELYFDVVALVMTGISELYAIFALSELNRKMGKVLIIDDEKQILSLLSRIIGLEGYDVYQAASCCPSAVVPSRPSHMPGRYPARNAAPSQTAQSGRRADMVLRFGSLVRSCGSVGRRSAVRAARISGLSAGLSLHCPADLPAAELSAASHYCPASLLLRPQ